MRNKSCKSNCKSLCGYTVAFGLGITVSCCCPYGFLMFISALIITALGIIVIRKWGVLWKL